MGARRTWTVVVGAGAVALLALWAAAPGVGAGPVDQGPHASDVVAAPREPPRPVPPADVRPRAPLLTTPPDAPAPDKVADVEGLACDDARTCVQGIGLIVE